MGGRRGRSFGPWATQPSLSRPCSPSSPQPRGRARRAWRPRALVLSARHCRPRRGSGRTTRSRSDLRRGNAARLVRATGRDQATGLPALAELALLCEARSRVDGRRHHFRRTPLGDRTSRPHDARRPSCTRSGRAPSRLDEVEPASAARCRPAAPRRPLDAAALVLPPPGVERDRLGDRPSGARRRVLADVADRRLRRRRHRAAGSPRARIRRGRGRRSLARAGGQGLRGCDRSVSYGDDDGRGSAAVRTRRPTSGSRSWWGTISGAIRG